MLHCFSMLYVCMSKVMCVLSVSCSNEYEWGVELSMSVSMCVLLSVVSMCVSMYGSMYMRESESVSRYMSMMSGFVSGMLLLCGCEDMWLLFVGWECIGIMSVGLIGYYNDKSESMRSSSKALMYNRIGDCMLMKCNYDMRMMSVYVKKGIGLSNMLLLLYGLLSGMLLYYGYYGLYVQYGVSDIGYSIGSKYVMISVMMSGGVKLAMYPVNVWLSKVHVESPTVGSVLLAGSIV